MSDSVRVEENVPPRASCVRPRYRRLVLRPIIDALAAWLVFGVVSAFVTCAPLTAATSPVAFSGLEHAVVSTTIQAADASAPAPVVQIATARAGAFSDAVFRRTSHATAWILLGLAFSLLAAINLMFFRHLRRAYATPMKRLLKSK